MELRGLWMDYVHQSPNSMRPRDWWLVVVEGCWVECVAAHSLTIASPPGYSESDFTRSPVYIPRRSQTSRFPTPTPASVAVGRLLQAASDK